MIVALALLAASGADAEMYRWVDQKGVVNYGSSPPPGVKARPVDPDTARVSVVPAPDKSVPAPAAIEQDRLRERVGKLEAQLEEERRRRAAAEAAESERIAKARADCEAQRRLNCDVDPFGQNEPVIVVQPVRRPIVRPHHPPYKHPPSNPGGKGADTDATPAAIRR